MSQFKDNELTNSQPVALYTFQRGAVVWRYTDQPADVTVSGVVYRAAAITHSALQRDEESVAGEVTVTVAAVTPIVTELDATGFVGAPISCTIRQTHRAGVGGVVTPSTAVRFKGRVTSRALEGADCAFTVSSLAGLLERPLLRVVAAPTCQHTVYDTGCGVDPASFTTTGCAVSAISGLALTVTDAASQADGYYTAGYLVVETGTAAGERCFIQSHVGDQLTVLNDPPPGLTTSDTIAITAGCDGLEATCRTKFSNVPFFLGFPRVPTVNPFDQVV